MNNLSPEKKARIKSIIYIVIAVICLAAIIFLIVQFANVNQRLKNLENSSSQTTLENNKANIIYYV
jgi:large-conductance mechanosensitive channel